MRRPTWTPCWSPGWPSSVTDIAPKARSYLEKAAKLSEDYFDVQLALGVLDTATRVTTTRVAVS